MADILLSFGLKTDATVSDSVRKDLDKVIERINKNPPKVTVGLATDSKAQAQLRKEIEAIVQNMGMAVKGVSNKLPVNLLSKDTTAYYNYLEKINNQLIKVRRSQAEWSAAGKSTADPAYQKLAQEIADLKKLRRDIIKTANSHPGMSGKLETDVTNELARIKSEYAGVHEFLDSHKIDMSELIVADSDEFLMDIVSIKNLEKQIARLKQKYGTFEIDDGAGGTEPVKELLKGKQTDITTLLSQLEQGQLSTDEFTSAVIRLKSELASIEVAALKNDSFIPGSTLQNNMAKTLEKNAETVRKNVEKWDAAAKDPKTSGAYKKYSELAELQDELAHAIRNGSVSISKAKEDAAKYSSEMSKNEHIIKTNGKAHQTFGSQVAGLAKKFTSWLTVSQVIMAVYNAMRRMVTTAIEVDTAMTELRKVTNETDATYDKFLDNAANRAKAVGATLTDVVNATASFARLGYDIDEAANLADTSIIYKNVADDIESIDDASTSIISTMQAFGVEASDAMSIVDKFNEVDTLASIYSNVYAYKLCLYDSNYIG